MYDGSESLLSKCLISILEPHFIIDEWYDRQQLGVGNFNRVLPCIKRPDPVAAAAVSIVYAESQPGAHAEKQMIVCCTQVKPVILREAVVVLAAHENRTTVIPLVSRIKTGKTRGIDAQSLRETLTGVVAP